MRPWDEIEAQAAAEGRLDENVVAVERERMQAEQQFAADELHTGEPVERTPAQGGERWQSCGTTS